MKGYTGVPYNLPNEKDHRQKMATMLNDQVNKGKINCTAALTLTPNVTTTTLIDERIGAYSYIDFMPLTAHAATAKASIFVTNQMSGQATVNHASSANTDQNFMVVILA